MHVIYGFNPFIGKYDNKIIDTNHSMHKHINTNIYIYICKYTNLYIYIYTLIYIRMYIFIYRNLVSYYNDNMQYEHPHLILPCELLFKTFKFIGFTLNNSCLLCVCVRVMVCRRACVCRCVTTSSSCIYK